MYESWVGAIESTDGGFTFRPPPRLVMPSPDKFGLPRGSVIRAARGITHNLALVVDTDGQYLAIGGQHRKEAS